MKKDKDFELSSSSDSASTSSASLPRESNRRRSGDTEGPGITVRTAVKSYGVGKRRSTVLAGLDMNVKKGSIYGLLGASGCGKTTLLSCIVGRRSLDSGDVFVFGGEPGTPESGIPGPRVGYMPQELALYGEFTIAETLEYFGRIYRLSPDFVAAQVNFLSKLLDLPPSHRYVKTLSGGQQRRVSFAVALFHEPELLILDEPTVGVDPLLRHSIWDHLVQQSVDHGRTVIITTHYIEEARQADTIGMMRSGHLLAEESPQDLLEKYAMPTLEDVFLKLCMKDGSKRHTVAAANETPYNTVGRRKQTSQGGHDNMAFEHTMSQLDVSRVGVEGRHLNNSYHPASLARYTVPHWKSTLPKASEDGVVGLTFIRYADNNLYSYNEEAIDEHQQRHINIGLVKNAINRGGQPHAGAPTTATRIESKQVLFPSGGGSDTNGSNAHSVTRDSDVANRCNGTTSPAIGHHRSRTFKLAVPSWHRTAALFRKNVMQTFRNIGMFLFVFLLPALQAVLFCLAIGHDPTLLKMAVVNDELDPSQGRFCNFTSDCTYSMFSCRYLRFLNNDTIVQVPFDNLTDALDATKQGEVWGVVHFGRNFTDDLVVRQADGSSANNDTLIGSRIGVTMDFSNQQITAILQRRLTEAFDDFAQDVLKSCDYEPAAATLPLKFLDPIYGEMDSSYTEFMAPGMILTIVYFIAVALTAGVFINERKQGLLDRSIVAGVQMTEILLAHLANQFTVLVGQTVMVFLVMLTIFGIPCVGNVFLAVLLTLLQGLCGMSFGLLVSSVCDTETSAIYLSLGSFYPTLLLSGIIWPVEGMSTYLRFISYFLPQTYAIESLRSIFARGWGIELPEVYRGILISSGWLIALLALSLVAVRIRKHTG